MKLGTNIWKLKQISLLAACVLALTACDPDKLPNGFTNATYSAGANLPFVNGRIAVVGCRQSVRPLVFPAGQRATVNPAENPQASAVSATAGSIHIVSVNTTRAYDYAYGRRGTEIPGQSSGITGYVVNKSFSVEGAPFEIKFTPDGQVGLVSFPDANRVAAFAIPANGVIRKPFVIEGARLNRPTRIAISKYGDYAWVVNSGNSTIQAIALDRQDVNGFSVPRPIGTNISLGPSNLFKIEDIEVVEDEYGLEKLLVAAGQKIFVVDTNRMLRLEPVDPRSFTRVSNPLAVFNGLVAEYGGHGMRANLVTSTEDGQIFWNDVNLGPMKLDGSPTPLAQRSFFDTGSARSQAVQRNQVVDIEPTPDSRYLMALTKGGLHAFDAQLGIAFQQNPLPLSGGVDLDVDPDGEFGLVLTESTRPALNIIRFDEIGTSSNLNGDKIDIGNFCRGATATAIRPYGTSQLTLQPNPALADDNSQLETDTDAAEASPAP